MDIPKRTKTSTGPKTHVLGLEYEKPRNQVPFSETFEKYEKDAHEKSLQNGSYAFPNELMRFRIEAKPIWGKVRNTIKTQS